MIPGRGPNHPTFRRSFLFAVQGFRTALTQERNLKVMLAAGGLTIVGGLFVGLDALSWAIVLVCCGIIIAAELINTAIEKIVDLVSPEFHPLAGQAKDIAAAAVWVMALLVAIVGILVFVRALFFV
ncbi:MAG: diacylglycerol kinase family protein [Coriobacteriales bacterium]|nr:diacylglycerol kinase family protein [Coriobacteriales bacterium]